MRALFFGSVCRPATFPCLKQLNSFQLKVWNEQPFFISFVESLVWRSCVTKLGSLSSNDGDWRRRLQKRHLNIRRIKLFHRITLRAQMSLGPRSPPYLGSSVAHSYHTKKAKTHFLIFVNPGIVPFFASQAMLIDNSVNELFLLRRMTTAVEAGRANS